ncbi:linear amide C-N hydrolase, partial [Sulfurimonas sp. MAG313]
NLYDEALKTPRWTSKYGSITFNQFAREIPTCGINEKGLAIVSMWHDTDKVQPKKDDNISELQWIQYQLDCYSSVNEIVKNLDSLSLKTEIYPMHYCVTDKSRNSAIIEFENGKLKAFESLDHFACSNESIIKSIEYSKKFRNIKADSIVIKEPILDRSAKALLMVKEFNESNMIREPVEYSFKILNAVNLQVGFKALFKWLGKGIPPSQTFWQIVFDLDKMKIHYKTKDNRNIRTIDVRSFDFSSESNVKVLNIDEGTKGDVTNNFSDYSRSDNERIVKISFKPMKDSVSESEQEEIIIYPELLKSESYVL